MHDFSLTSRQYTFSSDVVFKLSLIFSHRQRMPDIFFASWCLCHVFMICENWFIFFQKKEKQNEGQMNWTLLGKAVQCIFRLFCLFTQHKLTNQLNWKPKPLSWNYLHETFHSTVWITIYNNFHLKLLLGIQKRINTDAAKVGHENSLFSILCAMWIRKQKVFWSWGEILENMTTFGFRCTF